MWRTSEFRIQRRAAVLIFTALSLAESRSANLIVNGEFASGLTAWSTVGTVFETGQTAVLSDQNTSPVVLFQTVAMDVATTASLSLRFDLLASLSPSANVGQTPDTAFLTAFLGTVSFGNSYAAGLYDMAVPVMDIDFRGPANQGPGLSAGVSPKGIGWIRYSLALPVQPFVTVAFEFIDGNAIVGDSTVALDNVVLDAIPVPEPGAAALLLMGFVFSRRRYRH